MKAISSLILGLGNATLATAFNGTMVDHLVIAALATSVGLAGLLSWRWLLSRDAAQQLASAQVLE